RSAGALPSRTTHSKHWSPFQHGSARCQGKRAIVEARPGQLSALPADACPICRRAGGWCNVTVAQGMEGDGKKEDLTVLLRTSTHRTQKVRSSMEIVQRLRQRYLQFLQV